MSNPPTPPSEEGFCVSPDLLNVNGGRWEEGVKAFDPVGRFPI